MEPGDTHFDLLRNVIDTNQHRTFDPDSEAEEDVPLAERSDSNAGEEHHLPHDQRTLESGTGTAAALAKEVEHIQPLLRSITRP